MHGFRTSFLGPIRLTQYIDCQQLTFQLAALATTAKALRIFTRVIGGKGVVGERLTSVHSVAVGIFDSVHSHTIACKFEV